jgi:hydroxymethylbilane synthase
MSRCVRIGSRESALAIAQTRIVMDAISRAHPELELELVTMKTQGDINPHLPLEDGQNSGKRLFTGALEEALAGGVVDLCVHSLKDMDENSRGDLPVAAMAKRGDPRDCLVLPPGRQFESFAALDERCRNSPAGPAGCSSLRRKIQLRALVPSLAFAPVRGNVPTRIAKLEAGEYSLLILAAAGLERLGITGKAAYVFPVNEMIPAAGQGVLAIQGRKGEDYGFLEAVRDVVTEEEALTERVFVRACKGGCGSPTAAYARVSGTEIKLTALLAAHAEAPAYCGEISGPREKGLCLAEDLALDLLRKTGT